MAFVEALSSGEIVSLEAVSHRREGIAAVVDLQGPDLCRLTTRLVLVVDPHIRLIRRVPDDEAIGRARRCHHVVDIRRRRDVEDVE